MDEGSKNLSKNKLDARNFELSLEIKVGEKGRTLYFERGNNVHSGTRQSNAHMFDHLRSTIFFKELHEGMAKRHFIANITIKKILDARDWWPILFKDTHEFCRSYDSC
jgi:hypothetical protein